MGGWEVVEPHRCLVVADGRWFVYGMADSSSDIRGSWGREGWSCDEKQERLSRYILERNPSS
jgi:hypothetical protein